LVSVAVKVRVGVMVNVGVKVWVAVNVRVGVRVRVGVKVASFNIIGKYTVKPSEISETTFKITGMKELKSRPCE